MANIEITTATRRTIVIWDPVYQDDTVKFAGAGTLLAGTIMARDTSDLKLVPFVKGGSTNGNGIPNCVLLDALTAAGAGDVTTRPVISGRLRKGDLVIDADGNASNIDAAVEDQLRTFTIIAQPTDQLSEYDNQ